MLDNDIVIIDFELHSLYYIIINLGKVWKVYYPPTLIWIELYGYCSGRMVLALNYPQGLVYHKTKKQNIPILKEAVCITLIIILPPAMGK